MMKFSSLILSALILCCLWESSCNPPSRSTRLSLRTFSDSNIFVAAEEPATNGAFYLWTSIDDSQITKVSLCQGEPATCSTSLKEDIGFTFKQKGEKTNKRYFRSNSAFLPREGQIITILALNSSNTLVDHVGIKFSQSTSGPSLSPEQDINLFTSLTSQNKLSSIFKGKYFVADLSSSTCSACVALAKEHNSDNAFQRMFTSGTCSFGVIVPKADLPAWQNKMGSGFISSNSYGIEIDQQDFGKKFNLTVNAYPTVFIIDSAGQLIDSAEGQDPSKLNSLCNGGGQVSPTTTSTGSQTSTDDDDNDSLADDSSDGNMTGDDGMPSDIMSGGGDCMTGG